MNWRRFIPRWLRPKNRRKHTPLKWLHFHLSRFNQKDRWLR